MIRYPAKRGVTSKENEVQIQIPIRVLTMTWTNVHFSGSLYDPPEGFYYTEPQSMEIDGEEISILPDDLRQMPVDEKLDFLNALIEAVRQEVETEDTI